MATWNFTNQLERTHSETVLDEYFENRFRRGPVVGEWEWFVQREPDPEQVDQSELE